MRRLVVVSVILPFGCQNASLELLDAPPIARIDGPMQVRRREIAVLSGARSSSSSSELAFS